ncbi:MAG TPA: hypothetical protein VLA62_06450, partial [Solirubrobacterales bacterium]|nr:hypothetical protein [Solirubrobacterales bacterium]
MSAPLEPRPARGQAVAVAVACAVLVLAGWALTIRFNREGRWSALYCHGSIQSLPPEVAVEDVFRFPGTGFDGQYYHLIAHDPFLRRGFDRFVDDPRLRWRRGLLPVLAYFLALGRDAWIDVAYRSLILFSAAFGAYHLARLLAELGHPPGWGLAFLAVPGVTASLDRLTGDVVLVALTVMFVRAAIAGRVRALALTLVLAPLVRETGLLLLGGTFLARAAGGRLRGATPLALTALPTLAWFAFVHAHTQAQTYGDVSFVPLQALFAALVDPRPYTGK